MIVFQRCLQLSSREQLHTVPARQECFCDNQSPETGFDRCSEQSCRSPAPMNIVRSHFNQQKSRKPARQIQFNFYSCSRQLINIPEFKPSCIKSLKLKNKKYTTFVEKPVYTHTRRKEEAFRGGRFCPRAVHIDYISLFFSFFFFSK